MILFSLSSCSFFSFSYIPSARAFVFASFGYVHFVSMAGFGGDQLRSINGKFNQSPFFLGISISPLTAMPSSNLRDVAAVWHQQTSWKSMAPWPSMAQTPGNCCGSQPASSDVRWDRAPGTIHASTSSFATMTLRE